jgi:hypothetical protein
MDCVKRHIVCLYRNHCNSKFQGGVLKIGLAVAFLYGVQKYEYCLKL